MLRCEDEKKRAAYIGIGFRERDTAFSFKATLQDFERYVRRQRSAAAAAAARGVGLDDPINRFVYERAKAGEAYARAKVGATRSLAPRGPRG